ncbi:hypothetical protein [Streptacidiphilus carbonis]|uniref:hypothetical protein n=1 Tax=Streptacidiphilus carbonis TaxID=105422 RepID=UPI0005AA2EF1|nr:hypothetical protein [Streptacidiphilus carbonis]
MQPERSDLPVIRPLAAAHFRDALTATANGDVPVAVGALLAIDNESWTGIVQRLNSLGGSIADLLTGAPADGRPTR